MALGTKSVRGDTGVLIRVDMKEDMVGATNINFDVEKPKGTIESWTPVINGNFLEYTTVDGDLDQVGFYKISPVLTKGSFDGRGLGVVFEVIDKHKPLTELL